MGVYQENISKSQVDVVVRKMTFPFNNIKKTWFIDDNPLKSVFGAALSATFPPGEAEFIASVRLFRDQIKDEKLLAEIRHFIGQEGHHSHQHKQANERLKEIGLDAVKLEKILERDIRRINASGRNSPAVRLAFTCGAEHLTAIMADYLLRHPEWLDGAEDSVKELLAWHAVEEIEHKSVAFDTYMATVGDEQLLHRTMIIMSLMFSARISVYMTMLLWDNKKIPGWRDVRDFASATLGRNGLIRAIGKPYMDYFRKGFHPWDHDNRELVDQWKAAHASR